MNKTVGEAEEDEREGKRVQFFGTREDDSRANDFDWVRNECRKAVTHPWDTCPLGRMKAQVYPEMGYDWWVDCHIEAALTRLVIMVLLLYTNSKFN